tara:strand:+ start:369 stop:566 length:198 start_codon:yes stop_codon:yes gene_type:complete
MTKEIIDAIASGDNLSAETQFKTAMSTRVGDALELKRKDVAQTMVTQHIPEVDEEDEELQSDNSA